MLKVVLGFVAFVVLAFGALVHAQEAPDPEVVDRQEPPGLNVPNDPIPALPAPIPDQQPPQQEPPQQQPQQPDQPQGLASGKIFLDGVTAHIVLVLKAANSRPGIEKIAIERHDNGSGVYETVPKLTAEESALLMKNNVVNFLDELWARAEFVYVTGDKAHELVSRVIPAKIVVDEQGRFTATAP